MEVRDEQTAWMDSHADWKAGDAIAESVNALFKTVLVRGPGRGPWKTIDDLELATLSWVHWHNTERLHGYLDDVPPAEFEVAYDAISSGTPLVGITA